MVIRVIRGLEDKKVENSVDITYKQLLSFLENIQLSTVSAPIQPHS